MCLSFYLILNTSEAKIHFPSLCFDFQNSYCLKKWVNMKLPLKKLLVTVLKIPCTWQTCSPSLSVQTCQVLKQPWLLETELFCNQREFSQRLNAKIPPHKLSHIFMKPFRNFNSSTCFWDPENSQNVHSKNSSLFIRKNLYLFTFTKCQIQLNFLLGICFFWLPPSPVVLYFSSEDIY